MATITSANASFILTARVAGIFPAGPFQVRGFASDDAFAADAVDTAETRMGVDGVMSGGYTPRMTPQNITLQADSPSIEGFEILVGAQDALRDVIILDGVITLRSIGRTYAMVKGILTRITPMPPAKKVLEPVVYTITWNIIQPAPVAL